MTNNFNPQHLGKISEGILGDLDIYLVGLESEIDSIYNTRVSMDQNTGGEDGNDEFYFLIPSSEYGTKGSTTSSGGSAIFQSPKLGEEPIVLWKAFYQFVGKFFIPADPDDLDINSEFSPKSKAFFTLPKIPTVMVMQLDTFFRKVDKEYNTEAIVLLTYDFSFKGLPNEQEGWGFAVPEQKNTSVHCDYDKTKVIEFLPENTKIVGTIHSHPGMSAYASQTDHKDQSGFDGLHVTYGWLASNNNQTEYHAELVCGTTFYKIDPKAVMDLESKYQYKILVNDVEYFVNPDDLEVIEQEFSIDDASISEWISNVSKVNSYGSFDSTRSHGGSSHQGGGTPKVQAPVDTSDYLPESLPDFPTKPLTFGVFGIPDVSTTNIFVRALANTLSCPVCEIVWGDWAPAIYDRRQCLGCGVFLLFDTETIEDINNYRYSQGYCGFEDFLNFETAFTVFDFQTKTWDNIDVKIDKNNSLVIGGGIPKVQTPSV